MGIEIVPLTIRFGDEEFVDREELSPTEFWALLRGDARAALDRGARTGPVRAGLSPPGRRRRHQRRRDHALGRALGDDPERRAGGPRRRPRRPHRRQPDGVARARHDRAGLRPARRGRCRRSTTSRPWPVELVGRTRVFGALDTVENLQKGGRIGNAKALLATALAIKPIIEVADGVVEQDGKQRTRSKALAFLVDKVRSFDGRIETPRRAPRRLPRRRCVRRAAAADGPGRASSSARSARSSGPTPAAARSASPSRSCRPDTGDGPLIGVTVCPGAIPHRPGTHN